MPFPQLENMYGGSAGRCAYSVTHGVPWFGRVLGELQVISGRR
jgi:hypothetical protein